MRPDLLLFNQHVLESAFQTGVDNRMWGIENDDPARPPWPYVFIWVEAATKSDYPDRYYFRFDLNGYSNIAPTACPWDIVIDSRLASEKWPRGIKFVSNTFNPGWNPNALYAPCDRAAMPGHESWQQQFPELWWQSNFKIPVYLNFLHRLLNSADYANS